VPQNRTLHWSDGNEEVSITPPSNCALQPQASFRQSMVEARAAQFNYRICTAVRESEIGRRADIVIHGRQVRLCDP
jgi:hypothetical protein